MKHLLTLVLSLLLFMSCSEVSNLQLPSIISNGMILQQSSQVTLWGTALPGSQVKVTTDWDLSVSAIAMPDSTWNLNIATPRTDGQEHRITILAVDTIINIEHVMFGEVWLASGQSNMEMPLSGFGLDSIEGGLTTINNANDNALRFFRIEHKASLNEQEETQGKWELTTPDNAKNFSAVAYYYASMMRDSLNVPIGIIQATWSGTPIESWIDAKSLSNEPDFQEYINKLPEARLRSSIYQNYLMTKKNVVIDSLKSVDYNTDYVLSGNVNLNTWDKIMLPGYWEEAGLGDFDGAVWFVRNVEIPVSWIGHSLTLSLGAIDDFDNTYVNGVLMNSNYDADSYRVSRAYKVPARCVTRTNLTIAVLVFDTGGSGGFQAKQEDFYLQLNNKEQIALTGEWSYCVAGEIFNKNIAMFDIPNREFSQKSNLREAVTSNTPTAIYEGMIHPISNYKIGGVIWYQGEANVGRANQYQRLMTDFVNSLRSSFRDEDLPIIVTQIAPFSYGSSKSLEAANLREAQRRAVESISNCYIISTLDLGCENSIHPVNKREVGRRLALQAMSKVYGINTFVTEGPKLRVVSESTPLLALYFDNADGMYVDFTKPNIFQIAGVDGEYFNATVFVKDDVVTLFSHAVEHPVKVRYGYENYVEAILFNGAGLPACSFSTEQLYGN